MLTRFRTLALPLAALLLWCSACVGSPNIAFGLVTLDGDGNALLVTDRVVPATATIHLQYADGQSRPQCCKLLRGSDLQPTTEDVNAANKLTDAKPQLYRAKVPGDWADLPFVGLAAFGDVGAVSGDASSLRVTGQDGSRVRAELCLGREGVHLIDKRGGKVASHLYLWLGYEVESPTCR
ncbi:hypothetical protein ACQ86G_13535 [Roseateles chitinivorans]|uniref:hypothetical protein n=1 Tax=Roseateles chitinivorans TaxID=2917965 RepID=UPI003D67B46F